VFVSIKTLHVSVFFHDHFQGVLRCVLCSYYSSRWFAFVEFVLLRSMWPHVYVICVCLVFLSVGDLLVNCSQRFFQFWNAFWNVFCVMARRSRVEFSSISSTVWNRRPFSEDFNFGNKKTSAGAISGKWGGIGKIKQLLTDCDTVLFLCTRQLTRQKCCGNTTHLQFVGQNQVGQTFIDSYILGNLMDS